MPDHCHQPRPGESACFVCGVDVVAAARRDAGLPPEAARHEMVRRWYGETIYEECRRCAVEWPCPAVKAITRNAAKARRERLAAG